MRFDAGRTPAMNVLLGKKQARGGLRALVFARACDDPNQEGARHGPRLTLHPFPLERGP